MDGLCGYIIYLVSGLMSGRCFADAAKSFSEKKWALFGFNTILAINFAAWAIKWIFMQ